MGWWVQRDRRRLPHNPPPRWLQLLFPLSLQVSVLEFRAHFGAAGVPFEELLSGACEAGRSAFLTTLRRHPISLLMRRLRDQVR